MRSLLLVALGSALGGVARHWLTGAVAARLGEAFPWGTLAVNVLGSALVGVVAALVDAGRAAGAGDLRLFLVVGLLGGFTTFSAFSLQTLRLVQEGALLRASGNVVGGVALCLLAAAAGHRLARAAWGA